MKKTRTILPWPLLVVFILGTILRFINLGSIFLYFDEPIHSIRIDYQPLPFVLAHNNGSAFFAVLVHFLLGLGKTEIMARLPSVLFGSMSILAIYMLGVTLFTRREGLVAAALLAFSPFCIQFSQYSRGYATFMFMAILSLLFFIKAYQNNQKKEWVASGAFTVLAIYTHLMGFLILPAYTLFIAFMWLKALWKAEQPTEKKEQSQRLVAFGLTTALVLVLLFLLYLPDENVRGFLSASIDRVKAPLPFSYLFSYLSQKILSTQLQAASSTYWLWLSAIGLGFLVTLFQQRKKSLLIFLYVLVPFLIFLRINPREVNIQSADRYFVFILPLLLLLAAKGLTFCVSGLSSMISQFKPKWPHTNTISILALLTLTLLVISQFNLSHYYLYFWRFGSYRMSPEVWDCLKKNANQDSLIHLDSFPQSGQVLVLNILTRSSQVRGSEAVIRKGFIASPEDQDIMIFRSAGTLTTEINSEIGIWVVSNLSQSEKNILFPYVRNKAYTTFWDTNNHTILFFKQPEATLGQNVIHMCTAFLELDRDNLNQSQYYLMRARAFLLQKMPEKAYQDLAAARSLWPIPQDQLLSQASVLTKAFDRIFALNPTDLVLAHLDHFYNRHLANLCFLHAEENLKNQLYPHAIRAYKECLQLSQEFDLDISKRFFRIANVHYINGDIAQAYVLYQETARLNPNRFVAALLLAESSKLHVSREASAKVYQKVLGLDRTSGLLMKKLIQDDPLVLIYKTDSRWRVIFRGPKKNSFSGEIRTENEIAQIQSELFKTEDVLDTTPQYIRFDFVMDKRTFKTLEFQTPDKATIDFDIRINDTYSPERIILLGQGQNPQSIPFSLTFEKLNRQ